MISNLPKFPVARFAASLLSGLMLLVGPPLEALQGHVVLVPRESPPEWLAPWLESSWLEERREAYGHVTLQRNNLLGNLTFESTTRTRADGSQETLRTGYIHDRGQRPLETIVADGSKTKTEYNASGQVSAVIDALGQRTIFTYDDLGRQIRTTYADDSFEERFYDAENHLLESRDRAGRATTYTYDDVGRTLTTTYPGGAITQNVYDGAGRLITSIDARNKPTTYEYDKAGRRKRVINTLGFATEFFYDAAGNRTSVKDAKGNITAFVYDSLNRQVRTVFSDGTDMRTGYDVLGRRISSTDQAGKVTQFAYDKLGRLESVKDALDQVTSYGYDEVGNRISQTDANNHTTRFEYDAVGRQTKRILPGGAFERFTYDAIGNRKSRTDFNNVTTLYNYDNLHRLTQRLYPGNEQVSFTYTATGRRKTAVDSRGTTTYEYDNRDRLSKLIYPDGRELQYSYDQNNNREALTAVVGDSAWTSTYTYDDRDRLLNEDSVNYGWDQNGNLVLKSGDDGATYEWDFENRLKKVVLANGTIAEHTYDVDGTRVRTVTTPSGGPVQVVEYLVDRNGGLSQVVLEGGTVTAVSAYFVRGDDLISVIRPNEGSSPEARYYHADGLGSIRALTDDESVVTDRWLFEAFGVLTGHEGTDLNAYLFAGEPLEENSGWYYNRARWMNPHVGRFGSMDLALGGGNDPSSLHRYAYTAGDPVSWSDPTGLSQNLASLTVSAGIIGTLATVMAA